MRNRLRSIVLSLFLGLGLLVLGAASASAFSTTMSSNYVGGYPSTGDTITMYVDFNSTGNDILILSVSVLFNDDAFAWDQAASSSPTYALYSAPSRGSVHLTELPTNMTLRAGTSDQILLEWGSSGLPISGTRDQCGAYGTYPAVPGGLSGNGCGFRMATLVFTVIGGGDAAFTLSNSSPGNFFLLGDGSTPENAVSGDFMIIPEPTTALLVGLGLAGLGVAGRRRSSPPHRVSRSCDTRVKD
jgi:hypothetical protein